MPKQKALKKIAKCLELGQSTNVNEAANAIKMAQNLMLKYGLSRDDIEFIKMGTTQSKFLLPAVISPHILKVIRGINTRFGVEAVLSEYKGLKRTEFIGHAEHAIFAAFAFDVLYRDMNASSAQYKNSFAGSGINSKKIKIKVQSYTQGWIEGALDKLPVFAKNNTNEKLSDYIDKEFENLDRETFKQQMKDAISNMTNDYDLGLKKGRKLNINKPINGAEKAKQISLKP